LPERDRRRAAPERRARAGRRRGRDIGKAHRGGATTMGRGDGARVRWSNDRERKKKAAKKRQAAERGAERKASKKEVSGARLAVRGRGPEPVRKDPDALGLELHLGAG